MSEGTPAANRRERILRSLTVRVITFSTFWAVIALVLIATVISTIFRQVSERGFESVLSAHLYNVIGSVGVSDKGTLAGDPNLDDVRFSQPLSGWYWSVEPLSDELGEPRRSVSMVEPIAAVPASREPFSELYERSYRLNGPGGEELQVREAELVVGEDGHVARFRVMGNRSELETEIAAITRRLFGYLTAFGIGMIAINGFAIFYGLRPLRRVHQALSDIRAGKAQRLEGPFPPEIAPLATETNALIDNNRRIVERSRKQVGNLAHSLKTPLAVLLNEGRALGGSRGELIATQATALQSQLDHYLQRARAAAQRDSVIFRTPVNPVLERMVRVLGKLNPAIALSFDAPSQVTVFAGEREDLEEIIGNLLENAMKWAQGAVRVSLAPIAVGEQEAQKFRLAIEDDGPGIPEAQARDAIKRGRRLDETKPGTGLGLAIVADLIGDYGGTLKLDRSDLGGLRAEVTLPVAES